MNNFFSIRQIKKMPITKILKLGLPYIDIQNLTIVAAIIKKHKNFILAARSLHLLLVSYVMQ